MNTTPVSLLEKLRLPNAHADWARFVQLYTPLFCCWARRLQVPAADVEDFVQDVFTHLVAKLPDFHYEPGRRFRAWLWTVTLNRHRQRLRHRGNGDCSTLDNDTDPATPDTLDAVIEAEYQRCVVQRALELMQNEFAPSTWKAFWEYVMNDRPVPAVAAELGLSEGSVYAAKSRVLRCLRAQLKGLLEE